MVYGLDQSKMNCDRVFNIFCLYGNVEKVSWGGQPPFPSPSPSPPLPPLHRERCVTPGAIGR